MQTYVVGGFVRDALLRASGRTLRHESDRDWVVVGATPEEMLAAGFRPVGRDFPVFLHPDTNEEYALARTERKTGPGYHGFVVHAAPDVTLGQDLERRDLTINAMARGEDGTLHDPLGGREDLAARVLRHAGPAFVEDPVRILRLARFAARFPDFSVHPQTAGLLRSMVAGGEADALVPERVWQEISRGLMEERPSRMLAVLGDCGWLARAHPQLADPAQAAQAADRAADAGLALAPRAAVLAVAGCAPAHAAPWLQALRADAASVQLARMLADERAALAAPLAAAPDEGAAARAGVLSRTDAQRRPDRFLELLGAWGVLDPAPATPAARALWERALAAWRSVDAGSDAPGAIAAALLAARTAAVADAIGTTGPGQEA